MESVGPFFIGGDGRSGTTLLSIMLDSHPLMVCIPELHFNGAQNLGRDTVEGRNDRFLVRCARAGFPQTAVLAGIHKMLERPGWEGNKFRERCDVIRQMADAAVMRDAKECWGLKIMKEITRPGRYLKVFPDAKFLCMVRDPRDVYASQKQWPTWGYTSPSDASEGFLKVTSSFRAWCDENHGRGMFVRYETLVDQPTETMSKVLEFLGLPWSTRVLQHTEFGHALTASNVGHYSKDQVRKPVNDSAIGRYRQDLTEAEIDTINRQCSEEMDRWRYA